MSGTAIGDFTATGQSAVVKGTDVDVLVSGTFAGTVQLQAEDAQGNWIDVPDQSHTGPTVQAVRSAGERNWRLDCPAFTSGTIAFELTSATDKNRR